MHAELTVRHNGGALIDRLAHTLQPHDPAVITRSTTLGGVPNWTHMIQLAAETPEARLLCFRTSDYDVQVLVEPLQGDIRLACDTVWTAIHRSARQLKPSLRSLTVLDDATGREVAYAGVGFATGLAGRRDLWLALTTALIAILIIGIAIATSSETTIAGIAIGAVPALVGGALALGSLVLDARNRKLVWRA
jgi:hypothetical protein